MDETPLTLSILEDVGFLYHEIGSRINNIQMILPLYCNSDSFSFFYSWTQLDGSLVVYHVLRPSEEIVTLEKLQEIYFELTGEKLSASVW